MHHAADSSLPPDVCLLLRANAEQTWLSSELVPVLRQVRTPGRLPEEQLGAAYAYLEVAWLEAGRLAAETEAAFAALTAAEGRSDLLPLQARRYHTRVRILREAVAESVRALLVAPACIGSAREPTGL
jgi:hypothetical protein